MYKGKENKNEYLRAYAKYFGLTFQMILIVVMGGFGGKALDNWLNPQSHLFTIILIILAATLSLYLFFKTIFTK
jgi:F0F1-type ATP synthase assembly protein I